MKPLSERMKEALEAAKSVDKFLQIALAKGSDALTDMSIVINFLEQMKVEIEHEEQLEAREVSMRDNRF